MGWAEQLPSGTWRACWRDDQGRKRSKSGMSEQALADRYACDQEFRERARRWWWPTDAAGAADAAPRAGGHFERSGTQSRDNYVDPIAVERVAGGDRQLRVRPCERRAAIQLLTSKGYSSAVIAERVGVTQRTVCRARRLDRVVVSRIGERFDSTSSEPQGGAQMADDSSGRSWTSRDAAERERNTERREQRALAADSRGAWGMPRVPDHRTASPERLAYEAHQRGDRLFQIDLVVSTVEGGIGVGTHITRRVRADDRDVLGAIEAQGWHLEHVSLAYAQEGSVSTKRMLATVGNTLVADNGSLIGLYVFRRIERAPNQ